METQTAALWREFEEEAEAVSQLLTIGSTGADDRADQRVEQGRLRRADSETVDQRGTLADESGERIVS